MNNAMRCFIFFQCLALIFGVQICTTQADCTFAPNYSFCNSQGYCQCQSGYIFNCSLEAGALYTGSSTLNIPPQTRLYYTLNNITNEKLDYTLILTDNTQIDMIRSYSIGFFTDSGIGEGANIPTGTFQISGSQLKIDLELVLGSMPGTAIPQTLVMMIQNKQFTVGLVYLNYNFSFIGNSSTLLIIAYVGGASCLCITILMMIIVYRKRSLQPPNARRQNKNENILNDISHFDTLMPASVISLQMKREGKVCSVCLQEFQINSTVRTTVCGHVFHSSCIDQWCIKNLICPMCRTELTTKNILLLRAQNHKKDNQSSWVMNSIDYDEPQNQQPKERQPNSSHLNEPFLQPAQTNRPSIGNEDL